MRSVSSGMAMGARYAPVRAFALCQRCRVAMRPVMKSATRATTLARRAAVLSLWTPMLAFRRADDVVLVLCEHATDHTNPASG